MLTASDIANKYISFFQKRGHQKISNSPLVLVNDPTTLFTSSGMQPLVPYLLGAKHPAGERLVNVQNCFRAQDIDEIGDNRHTTFFRMLGNWSLGDYFKQEQLPWIFEFLTNQREGLGLNPQRLYVTVFAGNDQIPKDTESIEIWKGIYKSVGIDAKVGERIFEYGAEKNWWSRAGTPEKMPVGEPGGPDSEIFYEFTNVRHDPKFGETCHVNCDCGHFIEICNSVFMQYIKKEGGDFAELPQKNVDFGGGLERLLLALEDTPDVFTTSLLAPVISAIEKETQSSYAHHPKEMSIITDHFISATFIALSSVTPSNKEQGYILRRLIRRGLDNFYELGGKDISPVLQTIITQYADTNESLSENSERIKNTILEEAEKYERTKIEAKRFLQTKYPSTNEGQAITADDAFVLFSTHGLSPAQIKSLGYSFNEEGFAEKMKAHQEISRAGAGQKFRGGLADHSDKTIMGHTATHLLHQALRDVLGNQVHQTGSNITSERIRFDFNYDTKLTDEQIKEVEEIVNKKISENLPVRFEMMTPLEADKLGAIGLFKDTYGDKVKIYFVGDYSVEYCGGPHVDFTGVLKSFRIQKQENLGHGQKRIYAKVSD